MRVYHEGMGDIMCCSTANSGRYVFRSLDRSSDRSLFQSFDRSAVRHLPRSNEQSLDRSLNRWFDRSLGWTLDRWRGGEQSRRFKLRIADMLRNSLGGQVSIHWP